MKNPTINADSVTIDTDHLNTDKVNHYEVISNQKDVITELSEAQRRVSRKFRTLSIIVGTFIAFVSLLLLFVYFNGERTFEQTNVDEFENQVFIN